MANVIPMAGEGTRFLKEGYLLPKPLVPVSGMPMILKSIESMPESDKWIFIVRQEHIDNYKIDNIIKSKIPNAIIVPVSKTTEGQACTCMLAEPYLDPEEPIFIAACDNAYIYDKKKYENIVADNSIDAVVWTFTRNISLKENPNAFGWCILDQDQKTIKDMSIKTPISSSPYNDHAVVATFFFKKAKDFINSVNLMIKNNYRINNEFYVDAVPVFMNKLGKKSVIFDINYLLLWGTPKQLYEYENVEYAIKNNIMNILGENEINNLESLREYFR